MRIYLIGMPGSGKSTIGRMLAKKIGYSAIDLDAQIEQNALMFIDEIIEKLGIETFRTLESEQLSQITEQNAIVACGGGIVLNRNNKQMMNGIIIYLDTDLAIIEERLKTDYVRPLLLDNTLEDLYKERFLLYQHFADLNISNNKTVEDTILDIIEKIGSNL